MLRWTSGNSNTHSYFKAAKTKTNYGVEEFFEDKLLGSGDVLKQWLLDNPEVDLNNTFYPRTGDLPLHFLIKYGGSLENVRLLLDRRASVDEINLGLTPLDAVAYRKSRKRKPTTIRFEVDEKIVSVATEGNIIVVGSSNRVYVWDSVSRNLLKDLRNDSRSSIASVAIEDNTIVAGTYDDTVIVWNLASGTDKPVNVLEGHSAEVNSVAIKDNIIVSGSDDGTVKIWSSLSGKLLQTPIESQGFITNRINAVAIEGNQTEGYTIVYGDADGIVKVWDMASGKLLNPKSLEGHSRAINAVAIEGNTIVSGSDDGTVRVWNRTTGDLRHILAFHSDEKVNSVAIKGNIIVSGAEDNNVIVWDLTSGKPIQILEGHSEKVLAVAIQGNTIVSGSRDKTVKIWERNDDLAIVNTLMEEERKKIINSLLDLSIKQDRERGFIRGLIARGAKVDNSRDDDRKNTNKRTRDDELEQPSNKLVRLMADLNV